MYVKKIANPNSQYTRSGEECDLHVFFTSKKTTTKNNKKTPIPS